MFLRRTGTENLISPIHGASCLRPVVYGRRADRLTGRSGCNPLRHTAKVVAVGAFLTLALSATADPDQAPPLREWLSRPIASRDVEAHGMGYLPTDDATFANSAHLAFKAMRGLPDHVMCTAYLPPVANQGGQQSCVAWSCGYYVFSYQVAKERHFGNLELREPKWEFSPSFIYNQAKTPGGGMAVGQAFTFLKAHGCATLAEMPYDTHDEDTQPTEAAKERAAKFQNGTNAACLFQYLQADPVAMKTYLAEAKSPFTMAIPIYADFPRGEVAPDFVYKLTVDASDRRNLRGGHAITVVGYDEQKNAFRIVNSWGTEWGDDGFLWISQDFVKHYALEAWTEIAGGPTTRAFMRGPIPLTEHITYVPPAR